MSDRYILYCPKCGKVEGYVPSELTEEEGDLEPDVGVIEQEAVETNSGPARRIRCPKCGQWMTPDRTRPV